jgi:hypothetical protein
MVKLIHSSIKKFSKSELIEEIVKKRDIKPGFNYQSFPIGGPKHFSLYSYFLLKKDEMQVAIFYL